MNQRGVNGMAADRHLAQYGFQGHWLTLIRSGFWNAVQKRLTGLSWVFIPILLSGCAGPYSTLDPAGPSARIALWLWWAMAAYAGVVLLVVLGLWIYAIRHKYDDSDTNTTTRLNRRWIIGGGLVLPLVSITALLIFGIPAGHKMLPLPPEDGEAFRVDVTGHQWWWDVRYPDSIVALVNEVHIPAGVPVDVHLRSADVIHSFWVPRLGGKTDMIPGHTNVLRIQADEPGVYRGQCAEFCGRDHAHMKFVVHAHAEEDFEQWWQDAHEELEAND
ncbi:cytochrome c oxidase subunit II [Marinimicrobium sp. ABcell2]|uniref:cytochrome c oxidase subunit II n=1 Tax=Marinimicrobium sp. ABcell2 TaxID=3069751 RepID=UPI0027B8383D|nr:cytochrome c oxidase subunit II [Marinimicrobium sp. ABcell2]MDQ2076843.1 cytochrome c oxidase subunit II [Marinimicrobium sp. ABcell2]